MFYNKFEKEEIRAKIFENLDVSDSSKELRIGFIRLFQLYLKAPIYNKQKEKNQYTLIINIYKQIKEKKCTMNMEELDYYYHKALIYEK